MTSQDRTAIGTDAANAWSHGFALDEASLDISGNAPADGPWIREHLLPWCADVPPGRAQLRVGLTRSDNRAGRLLESWRRRRESGADLTAYPCVRLDRRTIFLEGWREDGRMFLVDPVMACHFIIAGTSVEIVAPTEAAQARIVLLSMVRETLVGRDAGLHPTADLHAAGFVLNGQAVLLAGARRSGKTTLLCHAALSAAAAVLASDRTLVRLDADQPLACGIPTIGSIRSGTLNRFPQLLAQATKYPAMPALGDDVPDDSGALRLSPSGFAGRLGVAQIPRAPLRAILLPEIIPGNSGLRLVKLAVAEAGPRMTACIYGRPEHRGLPTLFGSLLTGRDASAIAPEAAVDRLVAKTPIYRCLLGGNAYARSAALTLNIPANGHHDE